MSYFADLSQYAYGYSEPNVLNVGWLSAEQPFVKGETSPKFREALHQLVQHPILLHRGFHLCEFCSIGNSSITDAPQAGNGQIRVRGQDGNWYAAPTMIYHYVESHGYKPPAIFIAAVFNPMEIGTENDTL